MSRVICWYSSGIASATATKLMIDEGQDVTIVKTETNSEHPDNKRFDAECEELFGKKILYLSSEKYHDIWEVFEKTNYLVGVNGARCTTELKKKVRQSFQEFDDVHVFGYTNDEKHRAERLIHNNPEIQVKSPLIDRGWSKAMCFDYFSKFGIEKPMMYRLGFNNNNCIGCVKGGKGYWNHIRKHFPDVFERMSKEERRIGHAVCKDENGAVWLDEMPPDRGVHHQEFIEDLFSHGMSCDFLCGSE